ncbi:hypothetical protein HY358_01695 [Candidatus Roizmanbacteria bacterium]|nr:hypothetical protein [Candidatus Roizmanbacteria bacterium]
MDIGPAESDHDSIWILDNEHYFVGDIIYNHMHAYLADGKYEQWLKNLEMLKNKLNKNATFYMGHGEPGSIDLFDWQISYINTFIEAVKAAKDVDTETRKQQVTEKMKGILPNDNLLFLMQLSVEPVAKLITPSSTSSA